MSKTKRRAMLGGTAASAAAWAWMVWVCADGDSDAAWCVVSEAVLRVVTVVGAVAWLIATLLQPMVETCRVWYQLGQAQERRRQRCDCDGVTAQVIPFQRVDRS